MIRLASRSTRWPRWAVLSILALLVTWLLAACSAGGTSEPTLTPTLLPSPLPADASLPARIRARGHLLVGVRYDLPPFGYVTEEGELAGFDVDLARELARRWLGDPQAVHFRQVRTDTAVDHILAGDVDLVVTALLHSQELEEVLDFGPPVFDDGQALLVRASDVPTITAPADLEGRAVGVFAGSWAEQALAGTVTFTPTVAAYDSLDQALTALTQGDVSAVADLRHRLVRGLSRAPGTVVVGQFSHAVVAPAHAPGEPGLADLLSLTLLDMFADARFAELYDRWFPGDPPPVPEVWPGSATVTLETVEQVAPRFDTLAAIQARGRLKVAMAADRTRFAYLDVAGEPAGYEVELIRSMANRWLGDPTAVDFVPVALEEGLRMVAGGEADLLVGAVAHTRERELQADFALTTYVGGEGLMVRAGAPLGGIAGLDGQQVAAVAGTSSADVLRRLAQGAGISAIVVPKATLEEALAALEAGEVVAVVGERAELLGPAYLTPGIGVTADRLTRIPLAFALPPGDSAFRDRVNLTLQAMQWDGQLAAIYREWFDDEPPALEPWPGEPLHPLRIVVAPAQ